MQKELSLILKKIYPLSLCEVKSMEIEKDLEVKESPKKSEEKTKQENEEEYSEKPEKKEKKTKKKEDDSEEAK